jgi:4-hydroxybenzoate polyprenyltransferase
VSTLLLVLIAATGARTAAFALNRVIDRHIDAKNPRTALRELPSGRMTIHEASSVLGVGLLMYLGAAALLSPLCLLLSPIPLAVFTAYPFMKRFTALAHFGVGLGLAMGPLGGWFAVSPSFQNLGIPSLLCLFTMFWVAGFDIIYSTLDEEFDRREALFSFPSRFGRTNALRWSAAFHGAAFLSLTGLFVLSSFSLAALPLLAAAGILLYVEQRRAENVQLAFFRINAVAGLVVLGMVLVGVYT